MYFIDQKTKIFKLFRRVIGKKNAEHITAYGHFMGTLFLRTGHPAYAERFSYLKSEWIKALNIELGEEIISDMCIKVLPDGAPSGDVPDTDEYKKVSREMKNSLPPETD